MSLLNSKRNRDESSNKSNTLIKDNSLQFSQFKNDFSNINNENILDDNMSNNNYDLFQKIFNSVNSRKESINQNNIIMSPIFRSSVFLGSIQKNKNIDKMISNDNSKIVLPKSKSSFLKNKVSTNNKKKSLFSPFSSFKLEKKFNYDGFVNNNYEKLPLRLDFGLYNFSDKKNIFGQNSENKTNEENNTFDIFGSKTKNFFANPILNKSLSNNNTNSNNKKNITNQLSIQKGDNVLLSCNRNFLGNNPINTSLFTTININEKGTHSKKNYTIKSKNIMNKNKDSPNVDVGKKPFQTYNAKTMKKNKYEIEQKLINEKIFHIEKIYNKKQYKDAHEKEEKEDEINLINRFKISLKKIKQIYINSCLKIYSYIFDKTSFQESDLNNDLFLSNVIKKVSEIIMLKKLNSSKMNGILQVNDDDKYRKHYFMFTSDAKQFCLDLINKKNYPFDIVMKMCKVPRKSLRRWSYVGCQRKKGCGRKTKNPEMEEKLVNWYNLETKKGISLTAKMIRNKAMELSLDKEFLASKGWLEKFKRKFNINIVSCKNKKFKKYLKCEENKNIMNLKEEEDENNIDYEINIINEKKNNNDDKSRILENKNFQFVKDISNDL